MKVFQILIITIGVCVAFGEETPDVELPCCPDPPIPFGIGPVCRQCNPITLPCCPNPPLNPKFGPGPACRECPTSAPTPTPKPIQLPCCPNPPLNPKFGPGPACRICTKATDPAPC